MSARVRSPSIPSIFVQYPGYTTYKKDDVALLEVQGNIESKYVIAREDKSVDLDGKMCNISGWGYTSKYNKNYF